MRNNAINGTGLSMTSQCLNYDTFLRRCVAQDVAENAHSEAGEACFLTTVVFKAVAGIRASRAALEEQL